MDTHGFFDSIWYILLELAPWLLVGLAIAGLLHGLLPANFVRRQLRGRWGVAKAVLLGVPMPLCSCSVIPTGLGLKKDGASDGASVGFLISTPQTGVDSILVSASFLGLPFALFKVATAAFTGLLGGWLVDATGGSDESHDLADLPTEHARSRRGFGSMWEHSVELLRTVWGWLVIGILISATLESLLPPQALASLNVYGGVLAALLALVISLPLYVCATASVPIAAALIANGMPAGAALVFLMAGPASNIATIGAVYRGFGGRVLAIYFGTVAICSVAFGLLFDSVLSTSGKIGPAHQRGAWWEVLTAALLIAVLAWFAADDLRGLLRRRTSSAPSADPVQEVAISGMTCNGCVRSVENALQATVGVTSAAVTLESGKAIVHGQATPASLPRRGARRCQRPCRAAGPARRRGRAPRPAPRRLRPLRHPRAVPDVRAGRLVLPHPPPLLRRRRPQGRRRRARAAHLHPAHLPPQTGSLRRHRRTRGRRAAQGILSGEAVGVNSRQIEATMSSVAYILRANNC